MHLDSAFNTWHTEGASLLSTTLSTGETGEFDIVAAIEIAHEEFNFTTSDGAPVIPLFEPNEPRPTPEYVLYRPDHDQLGWWDEDFGVSGTVRWADAADLGDTQVGRRLRYWLPEYRDNAEADIPDEKLPPSAVEPTAVAELTDNDEFFGDLRQFVKREREEEKDQARDRYFDHGFSDAKRRGLLAGPFSLLNETRTKNGQQVFQYQLLENEQSGQAADVNLREDEGLFNGNICLAVIPGEDISPVEVSIPNVGDNNLDIALTGDYTDRNQVETALRRDQNDIWLHALMNPVPYDRRLEAISNVERRTSKRGLAAGTRPVSFHPIYNAPTQPLALNEYQKKALFWAASAEDLACIHGPPGTGKTRTLTAYLLAAVANGKRVLVTAHSNQAVDNLLAGDSTPDSPEEDSLHWFAQYDPGNDPETDGTESRYAASIPTGENLTIARAGSNSSNRTVREYYARNATASADVVAATTSGAAQFDVNEFDVAVVDEATQASRPATAIAVNAAEKLVLAGDHKQLPPFCASEDSQEEEMHISLFEHLLEQYDKRVAVTLRKQYRMHADIAQYPNSQFYDGDLETAAVNVDWTLGDLDAIVGIDIKGGEQRPQHGTSYYNSAEAKAATRQVEKLLDAGVDPADIGVITAYTGQIGKIKSRIGNLDYDDTWKVTVDTVDSFQGGEREAIIVSFVRSNDDGHSGFLEFPDEGKRRLNVAITRARKRLVLIGDWDTLGTIAPHRDAESSCAPSYAALANRLREDDLMIAPSKPEQAVSD